MNFRPTKGKVIVCALIVIAVILYARATVPLCEPCETLPECVSYNDNSPFPKCGCNLCIPLIQIIGEWILVILSGVVVYVVWSLIQKRK